MQINAYSSSAGPLHWPAQGLQGLPVPLNPFQFCFAATAWQQQIIASKHTHLCWSGDP